MRKREHDEQCKQTFINKQLLQLSYGCEEMKGSNRELITSIQSWTTPYLNEEFMPLLLFLLLSSSPLSLSTFFFSHFAQIEENFRVVQVMWKHLLDIHVLVDKYIFFISTSKFKRLTVKNSSNFPCFANLIWSAVSMNTDIIDFCSNFYHFNSSLFQSIFDARRFYLSTHFIIYCLMYSLPFACLRMKFSKFYPKTRWRKKTKFQNTSITKCQVLRKFSAQYCC